MRNVFDQYSQPENRLTHALVTTLFEDRSLLRPFARWAGATAIPPKRRLHVTEQQVPGVLVSGDEDEGRGLPDASIYDDDGWLLMIESKVQAGLSRGQLLRHRRTAERHGFKQPHLLVLSVDEAQPRLPDGAAHREWREVYRWFRSRADQSAWARRFSRYIEIFESRMVARDYAIRGTLTMFDGLRFDEDNPYTYGEAKRLLRNLGEELRKRSDLERFGVDPAGPGRSAITGRGEDRVWDYLPLKAARGANSFTDHPHLTIVIGAEGPRASVTIPNGVKGGFRGKLKQMEYAGFLDVLREVERGLRPVIARSSGATPAMYAVQRHYRSQRSVAEVDGRLDFDLRTIVERDRSPVKWQPQWSEAVYDLVTNKRSNIQIGTVARFSYDCPMVRSRDVLDLFAESWIAMKPMLDLALAD